QSLQLLQRQKREWWSSLRSILLRPKRWMLEKCTKHEQQCCVRMVWSSSCAHRILSKDGCRSVPCLGAWQNIGENTTPPGCPFRLCCCASTRTAGCSLLRCGVAHALKMP